MQPSLNLCKYSFQYKLGGALMNWNGYLKVWKHGGQDIIEFWQRSTKVQVSLAAPVIPDSNWTLFKV